MQPPPSKTQNAEPQGRIAATSAELPSSRARFRTLPLASMLAMLKRLDAMAGQITRGGRLQREGWVSVTSHEPLILQQRAKRFNACWQET